MSATQAIHLVDQLVKASIPKQTATELVEYVESQNGAAVNKELSEKVDKLQIKTDKLQADVVMLKSSVSWIKWIMGIGFGLITTVMVYLHSNTQADMRALRADMQAMETRVKTNMQEMETRIMQAIEAIGARK